MYPLNNQKWLLMPCLRFAIYPPRTNQLFADRRAKNQVETWVFMLAKLIGAFCFVSGMCKAGGADKGGYSRSLFGQFDALNLA